MYLSQGLNWTIAKINPTTQTVVNWNYATNFSHPAGMALSVGVA